jgi:hypothetical protein
MITVSDQRIGGEPLGRCSCREHATSRWQGVGQRFKSSTALSEAQMRPGVSGPGSRSEVLRNAVAPGTYHDETRHERSIRARGLRSFRP